MVAYLATDAITEPTPIQIECIPPLRAGRDLVGQARTGSGKTLAYAIPLVEQIVADLPAVQALVLAPTRELADQVASVTESLGRGSGVKVVRIVGGVSYGPQRRGLAEGAQVVVGTPGRILDLMESRQLEPGQIHVVVLDEADQMFDIGMAPQVEAILRQVPSKRQTSLFSATVPAWVRRLTARHLNDPLWVALDTEPDDRPEIDHEIWIVPKAERSAAVERILRDAPGVPTLVFGRTRREVDRLSHRLRRTGLRVDAIQGGMPQQARTRVMAKFRDGSIDVLIATNVAARGLDIDGLAQVVNYDVPDSPDLFTHRTGRTGRMGGGGRSFTLVSGADLDHLKAIERSLNRRLPRTYWDELQPAATNVSEAGAEAEPLVATVGANGHRVLPGERLNGRPARPERVAAGGDRRRRNGRR